MKNLKNKELKGSDFIRKIVIGDIHGCYYTLMNLLEKINYNHEEDTIIFLGDYIDRGKNSYEVVDFLIKLQGKAKDKCICLMGNHEHMAITDESLWKINGSNKTISSYYRNGVNKYIHFNWFRNLPLTYETDEFIACHAGLPQTKLVDNSQDDILWDRKWVNDKIEPNEKLVIFGHTPSTNLAYRSRNGNICVDSACVFGYQLCALIYEDGKYDFVYENKNERD